jgi:hypothetical protein
MLERSQLNVVLEAQQKDAAAAQKPRPKGASRSRRHAEAGWLHPGHQKMVASCYSKLDPDARS